MASAPRPTSCKAAQAPAALRARSAPDPLASRGSAPRWRSCAPPTEARAAAWWWCWRSRREACARALPGSCRGGACSASARSGVSQLTDCSMQHELPMGGRCQAGESPHALTGTSLRCAALCLLQGDKLAMEKLFKQVGLARGSMCGGGRAVCFRVHVRCGRGAHPVLPMVQQITSPANGASKVAVCFRPSQPGKMPCPADCAAPCCAALCRSSPSSFAMARRWAGLEAWHGRGLQAVQRSIELRCPAASCSATPHPAPPRLPSRSLCFARAARWTPRPCAWWRPPAPQLSSCAGMPIGAHCACCTCCTCCACDPCCSCSDYGPAIASSSRRSIPTTRVRCCSDCGLPSRDSDAMVLRAAVLLDEMIQVEHPDGGGPTVAAQVGARLGGRLQWQRWVLAQCGHQHPVSMHAALTCCPLLPACLPSLRACLPARSSRPTALSPC